MTKFKYKNPFAITMWDFSWLERRWPGAGYENCKEALDGLVLRGYNAVRIDVYPHLLEKDPHGEWTIKPEWSTQVWGAPALTKIENIKDNLLEFLKLCKERQIMVGLSTWFREDIDNTRMQIEKPSDLARMWSNALDIIDEAGLNDTVLYVDLCNEYPLNCWVPFLRNDTEYQTMKKEKRLANGENVPRASQMAARWINESLMLLRKNHPQFDYTFSQTDEYDTLFEQDTTSLDILEPHLWMASYTEYYKEVGYNFERFETTGYDNMALYGEKIYREKADYWDKRLLEGIDWLAKWSKYMNKYLITTECWGIVDYKDWPLLNWDWVKHLCEIGVVKAVSTKRWVAIATSNFCGPQFIGMWDDIAWHQRLTKLIKGGDII